MVNNDFHIIGIGISNFLNVGNDRFPCYLLRVEVEKQGSKNGKNFEIEVSFYGSNTKVDFNKEMLGRQVIINGYLDSYETKDGKLMPKIVGQNCYILDKDRPSVKENAHVDNPQMDYQDVVQDIDTNLTPNNFGGGDDLPF